MSDEANLSDPAEQEEVMLARKIRAMADRLLSIHGLSESSEDSEINFEATVEIAGRPVRVNGLCTRFRDSDVADDGQATPANYVEVTSLTDEETGDSIDQQELDAAANDEIYQAAMAQAFRRR